MQRDFDLVRAEFVLCELELASTFLDLAAATEDPIRSHKCVLDAILAVRTADRLSEHSHFCASEHSRIRALRQQLSERFSCR